MRDWLSYTTVAVKTLVLGPSRRPRRTPPGPRHGRFRRWRHSRPFWGGLLLILAGGELVLIPLSGILLHGAIKLVIYIGIGGVFGVLIGLLLITAGLLLWISPAHKTFYAIAGVVLAVLSFIASNLGGFFLGMLLGITGGALAFGWTPDPVDVADVSDTRPLPPVTADDVVPFGDEQSGRLLAAAAMPVLLAGALLTGHAAPYRSADPRPTASPSSPAAGPSSPAAGPSSPAAGPGSPAAGPGSPAAGPGSAATSPRSSSSGANSGRARMIARADLGLEASTATTVLTAGSATLDGLAYQGTAKVPTADGGQTMMVFTLNSMSLSGNVTTTVTQDGQSTVTTASSLDFAGGITLYATQLSGSLFGVPTTLTPGNVLTVLLQLLNTLTPLVPLTMTNVTTDQPLVIAGTLQAVNLNVAT
jgi:hypothetical protein